MKKTLHIIVILFLVIVGCVPKETQEGENRKQVTDATNFFFEPKIKHAKQFTIKNQEGYKSVIVANPWEEGDTLMAYALYPRGTKKPKNVDWADFAIEIPVDELVTTTSPQVGLVGLLGEIDKIKGVATDQYIFNSNLYEKVQTKEVAKIGSIKGTNLEVVLDLDPDLVLKTGFDNVLNQDERLIEAGVPLSYNIEWMESTMLARAEWVKYLGAFLGKDQEADSIFNSIEKQYMEVINIAKSVPERPSILTGNNFKGTWFMPSSDSYLAKVILDAGADYFYKNEKSTGSLPLSFESVLDNLIDADYWIGPRAQSLQDLEMQDERYKLFKPFKEKKVYTFNKRMSENGGNDYWETGMTRPDIILKDLVKIFHPELLPNYDLYYYKNLQ